MSEPLLIEKLYEIGAIKFGTFTLKSGIESPIYIDLRLLISYPSLLKLSAEAIWKHLEPLQKDTLCGVPYTALPIATALSLSHDIPMLMRRKEAKNYGTKQLIEGVIKPKSRCVIIEDLITTGSSIFETIEPLENAGVVVKDVIVLLNREQGGRERLSEKGYTLHSVLSLPHVLEMLSAQKKISNETVSKVTDFLHANTCICTTPGCES